MAQQKRLIGDEKKKSEKVPELKKDAAGKKAATASKSCKEPDTSLLETEQLAAPKVGLLFIITIH